MPSLKNFTRRKTEKLGETTWELHDEHGVSVEAFSYFCKKNNDYAFATKKRYAEVVAAFLDYLTEAKAFGVSSAPTKQYLNAVIDAYPVLLRDGSEDLCRRVSASLKKNPEDKWLADVSHALNRKPLAPASFSNSIAAINRFLRLSESLATEAFELATIRGLDHSNTFPSLIAALSGAETVSASEKRNMRMNSVLGSVLRFRQEGLTRPRRLINPSEPIPMESRNRDFPLDYVFPLADAASSSRDKALWLLLAASGIRISEALNLRWSDIETGSQKVYVLDPKAKRLGGDLSAGVQQRFKGRETSMTYLIQPFREAFFVALEQYFKNEYVMPRAGTRNDYVFQYVESSSRGKPYVLASDAAFNKSFRAACDRASVPAPGGHKKYWTLHSLRHLYGVYMVNDLPVNPEKNHFGLNMAEVQVLMGHKSIRSTQIYARKKRRSIERILSRADKHILGLDEGQFLAIPRHPGEGSNG